MKKRYWALAALIAFPLFAPSDAEAAKCRQYTKTIRIDGNLELGVGQACQRYDGSWEIVSLKGPRVVQENLTDHIYDDLYDDGFRVVYVNNYIYSRPHHYSRPRVTYYQPRPVHYGFYFGDFKGHGHKHKHYKKYERHDRHARHDRRHHDRGHRGKSNGHKKHH